MKKRGKKCRYKKKRGIVHICCVVICIFFCICVSCAMGSMKVMQTHTGDTDIAIYVKGIDEEASGASVQIGTESCASIESKTLSELKYPVKTLVMLDNSLSIPESAREKITGILQNIISDRESYEEIAIATYDNSINYLTEYTSDYTTLKAAADNISYHDLETHLTSVLYDLISKEYIEKTEDSYWRIVVISDGIDDQSVDSTREELYVLMKEKSVPIYTVGMQTGKNQGQLADLFALSRQSNADSFVLDDMEELLDINTALNTDRSIVRFSIVPKNELMDGSRKTVRISLPSGNSVSVEMAMPQRAEEEEPQTDSSLNPEPVPEPAPSSEPESDTESTAARASGLLPIAAVGAVVLITVGAAVFFVTIKGGKKDKEEKDKEEKESDKNDTEERRTVIMPRPENDKNDKSGTLYLFGNNGPYNILFTDMDSPRRTFHYSLKKVVVIGAGTVCEIAINGDDYISGRHCRIETKDGKFYLQDLQSKNGTFLNGSQIFSETEIYSGDELRIGDTRLRFEVRQ